MPSKREQMRAKALRRQRMITAAWIGAALVVVAIVAYVTWQNNQPKTEIPAKDLGESIPLLTDTSHVPEGTDPGPYNSNPPTSGRHYADPAAPGFYDGDPYPSHPEGHLVHSLEHGYIIFWYNCDLLSAPACDALKSQIKDVLESENNFKVIGFPWTSIDVPVVLTSWGKLLKMETFDPDLATAFVQANRNHAPEPDAP
jgi:hypothetical protein